MCLTEGVGLGVALGIGLGVVGGGVVALGSVEGGFTFEQAASPAPTTPSRAARRLIRSM